MKTQTVREALRDAIAEEMRRDENVFMMGEEVAEYEGAYKITQGLLDEFGAKRIIDTPITEHGFAGVGVGAAFGGLKPVRRVHDLQLRDAGHRPDRELRGQDAVHVGRPDGLPDGVPRPQRRRRARRRPAQPGLRRVVCAGAGAEGGDALHGRRLQRPDENRDPRPQPGDLPRKRDPLRPQFRGAGARRFHHPLRQGPHRARRQRRDAGQLWHRNDLRHGGRREAGRGRGRGRGRGPAHPAPDRLRHGDRLGA